MVTHHPRTILLTGASGFVGEAILDELLHAGHRVLALSRRRPPRVHPRMDAVRLDLGADDLSGRLAALPRFDAAIHAAGAPKFLDRDERGMHRLHVESTIAIARECAARGARLLHVSTAFVCPERDGRLAEGPPGARRPANAYERTKTEAEHALSAAGLPPADILRPAIVVPERDSAVDVLRASPLGAFMAVAGQAQATLVLPGCARATLAFTRRGDLSAAARAILDAPVPEHTRRWNLCAPPFPSLGDIAKALHSVAPHRSCRFADGFARRLLAWEPYLAGDRSWDTDDTRRRLGAIGAPLAPVAAEDIARCCARLVQHSAERLCA